MDATPRWLNATAAFVLVLSFSLLQPCSLLAASQSGAQLSANQQATIDRFVTIRPRIANMKRDRYHIVAHLNRIAALFDVLNQRDARRKLEMLQALGITVNSTAVEGRVILSAKINAFEKVLWSRPALSPSIDSRRRAPEQPDGGTPPTRMDDPQNLDEAETYAAAQWAAADAMESEWTDTEADYQEWIDGGADCPLGQVDESPDGGTPFVVASKPCMDEAIDALEASAAAVLGARDVKTAVNTAITELRGLISSYQVAFEAGTITGEMMENMIGGALIDFVATIDIGWIAAGILVAAAVVVGVTLAECIINQMLPTPAIAEDGFALGGL